MPESTPFQPWPHLLAFPPAPVFLWEEFDARSKDTSTFTTRIWISKGVTHLSLSLWHLIEITKAFVLRVHFVYRCDLSRTKASCCSAPSCTTALSAFV